MNDQQLSHILQHLGEDGTAACGPVAPPILQTGNFHFDTVAAFSAALEDEYSTTLYSRGRNPTVDLLRQKLAALDGAEDALVVNSGSTAIVLAVFSQVKAGDHIVAVKGVYAWAQYLFDRLLPQYGITTSWVDGSEVGHIAAAIRDDTTVIYLESPTSWVYEEQDIPAVTRLAREKGIVTILDNTYCTPIYQPVIEMGVDIAIQSASKYICGHSDVIAGVISASAIIIRKIFEGPFLNMGAGIMPFNAWLLLRSLRTLPVRLEQIRKTAAIVLEDMQAHPAVEMVLAPKEPVGLFTLILKTREREDVVQFCEGLRYFKMAVSWGGHESLVMPKCAAVPEWAFDGNDPLHRSVRLYTGLEAPELLIKDLRQGLEPIRVAGESIRPQQTA